MEIHQLAAEMKSEDFLAFMEELQSRGRCAFERCKAAESTQTAISDSFAWQNSIKGFHFWVEKCQQYAPLSISDLENGDVVKLRNGVRCIFIKEFFHLGNAVDSFVRLDAEERAIYARLGQYNDDLICTDAFVNNANRFDIVEVWRGFSSTCKWKRV